MKVLIAYDGSDCSNAAIENLKRAGLPHEGEALVVSVADESWPHTKSPGTEKSTFANPWADSLQEAETFAKSAADQIQSGFPAWTVSSEALWGSASKAVLKTIGWWKPDLLIVGSHGRSAAGRLVMGSVSLNLLHHAKCAVRVVRSDGPAKTGPIRLLVATDGSPASDAVLREIARRSWPEGTMAHITAVVETVVPAPTMAPALESSTYVSEPAFQVILEADKRERARLRDVVKASSEQLERAGLKVDPIVLEGNARTELVAEAKRWEAETIFMGA